MAFGHPIGAIVTTLILNASGRRNDNRTQTLNTYAASEYLPERGLALSYPYRKVWRKELEVMMKIKVSQGKRRVEWVKLDHPFTAIIPKSEVYASHNEANNVALRRRCRACRRHQNLYAKTKTALQRTLDVRRMIHNWARPHWGFGDKVTLAWPWDSWLDP